MTSVMSLFNCTLPFPRYYPISDPTQSSVTSVMSMFNFAFLSYYPISDLTQSSVASVILMSRLKSSMTSVMSMFSFIPTLLVNFKFPISHIIRDIRDVNDQLHPNPLLWSNLPSPQCVADKFPTSHIIRDIRDVNDQFHPNSSPLWSNLPSPQCVAESWHIDIKFRISAGRRRIMTHRHQISGLRRASQDHDIEHQISDLRRASKDHNVNTTFPHPSFRSPQRVAGSHSIV